MKIGSIIALLMLIGAGSPVIAMEKRKIDIFELTKWRVLRALYERARKPEESYEPLSEAEAQWAINKIQGRIAVIKGRTLNVNLSGTTFDPKLYDKVHGSGAAEEAIEKLRYSMELDRSIF